MLVEDDATLAVRWVILRATAQHRTPHRHRRRQDEVLAAHREAATRVVTEAASKLAVAQLHATSVEDPTTSLVTVRLKP